MLFEDPDILQSRLSKAAHVHLLNTAAYLQGLGAMGLLEDADTLISAINASRKTPMLPFEKPARTRKIKSSFLKAVGADTKGKR